MRAERAEVAEANHGIDAAPTGVADGHFQGQVVAVNTAENAIRLNSRIASAARRVGTKSAILVTGVTSVVPQGVRNQRLFQGRA